MHRLSELYREHRVLLWLAAIYLPAIPVALWVMGAERFYRVPIAPLWNPLLVLCCLGVSVFRMLADPDWTRRWPSGLLIYVLVAMTAGTFLSWKQALIRTVPFTWDQRLAAWDAKIHFGPPWRYFSAVYADPSLLWLVDRLYLLWVPIQFVVTFTVGWWPPSRLRTRYLLTHAALWIGLATIGAATFGSVGPCFLDRWNGDQQFVPLMDRLRHGDTLLAVYMQDLLWRGYESNAWNQMNGISAMPSMHIAVTTLVALLAWQSPLIFVRVIGIAFLLIIEAGSVILGWHYAVDGYVAAAVTVLLWIGIGRLLRESPAS